MKRAALSMLTALALLGGVAAARNDRGIDRANYAVFNDVAREVLRYVHYTIFDDVRATVENGTVTLTGAVTMPFKKDDIGRRVARVPGVQAVRNLITVLPVSSFDEDLRYRTARAIYGNPSFWHYASMVNPPIHIVVERGHVVLTGVVHSQVERMLARSLATSLGAFSVKNELKTDAEMQAAVESVTE
jgi:osmotically-inducible protein OsmY